MSDSESPTGEDIDLLLSDPSLAQDFDEMYGAGKASKHLTAAGLAPDDEDLALLREMLAHDPDRYCRQFDEVYGRGAAQRHLELPDPAAGPAVEDIELLLADPTLSAQFDEMYGEGAAAGYLPTDFADAAARGTQAYKAQKFEEALRLYSVAAQIAADENSVSLSPQQMATLFLNTAKALAKLSRFCSALERCESAATLLKQSGYSEAKALYSSAEFRLELCDFRGALRDLERATELDPDSPKNHQIVELCKQRESQSAFSWLGVTEDQVLADPGCLKKAYRAQCKIWHPDRNAGGSEDAKVRAGFVFPRLQAAYEGLCIKYPA